MLFKIYCETKCTNDIHQTKSSETHFVKYSFSPVVFYIWYSQIMLVIIVCSYVDEYENVNFLFNCAVNLFCC